MCSGGCLGQCPPHPLVLRVRDVFDICIAIIPPTPGPSHLARFRSTPGFDAQRFAHELDSLVRVSRRVGCCRACDSIQVPRVEYSSASSSVHAQHHQHPLRLRTSSGPTLRKRGLRDRRSLPLASATHTANLTPTASVSTPTISRPLHSLSKVLSIFPSRYLFAIGLPLYI